MRDGREALVVIETLKTITGGLKARELAEAWAWAAANTATLNAKWQALNP